LKLIVNQEIVSHLMRWTDTFLCVPQQSSNRKKWLSSSLLLLGGLFSGPIASMTFSEWNEITEGGKRERNWQEMYGGRNGSHKTRNYHMERSIHERDLNQPDKESSMWVMRWNVSVLDIVGNIFLLFSFLSEFVFC
jgi:hypothetical protein